MPATVGSLIELAPTGAGWELRCTEALSVDSGSVSETIAEALEAVDRGRPIEEQLVHRDGERPLLAGPSCCLRIEPDGGTYWVVAVEGQAEHLPTERDRWRRDRACLARWISELRVVGPLLHKRAADVGKPCRCELPEGGWLGVAREGHTLRVYVAPPAACSADEARRLAALAAVCVVTRPG